MQEDFKKNMPEKNEVKLNIGCGRFSFTDWINIDKLDFPNVNRVLDISKEIPYENESIDEIYAGHFLEHLDMDSALKFLAESFRVLKKGMKIIIVIPDAKKIYQQFDYHQYSRIIFSVGGMEVSGLGFSEDSHRSIWDSEHLILEMKKVGFEAREIETSSHLIAVVKWQTIVEGMK